MACFQPVFCERALYQPREVTKYTRDTWNVRAQKSFIANVSYLCYTMNMPTQLHYSSTGWAKKDHFNKFITSVMTIKEGVQYKICIKMFSSLSGAVVFWKSPHLNILCISLEKPQYSEIPIDSSMTFNYCTQFPQNSQSTCLTVCHKYHRHSFSQLVWQTLLFPDLSDQAM